MTELFRCDLQFGVKSAAKVTFIWNAAQSVGCHRPLDLIFKKIRLIFTEKRNRRLPLLIGGHVSEMTNPENALNGLQGVLNKGFNEMSPGVIHSEISVIFDAPQGVSRFSYAKIVNGQVEALSIFALVDPLEGIPCFNLGYAVPEILRNKGLGTEIVSKGIRELRAGLAKNGLKQFYLEAVIGLTNLPSQKIAKKVISPNREEIIDSISKEPAFVYRRLIE